MSGERDSGAALEAIDILAPAFEASGLQEVELEVGELRVRLARPAAAVPAPAPAPAETPPPAASVTPFGEPAPGMRFVTAPLTGVWYGAPSPGARAYVTEGSEIGAGAVVGLIEAMKLFNEIKSDVAGRVTRVLIDSGTLVKRQQPLLEIDPN